MKKALCVFAHPDDSFLFAHNIRRSTPDVEWFDLCLTYRADQRRGREFVQACAIMESQPLLAGLIDNVYETPAPSVYQEAVTHTLGTAGLTLDDFTTVVTHNPVGEYGHGHHKAAHRALVGLPFTAQLLMPAHNYAVPETTYVSMDKLKSPLVDLFESEHYLLFHFDLITEGFVTWQR